MKKTPDSDAPIKNPHNNFFIKCFSNKAIAKGYFKSHLPSEVIGQLDFRTLKLSSDTFIDAHLKPHYSDLIYTCKWKKESEVFLSIIIEHQSKKPAIPHLKMLRYLLNGFDYQIAQQKSSFAKRSGRTQLSVIIPMFLYHGKTKWKFQPFFDFFEPSSGYFQQFIPNFAYILDNLTATSDEELKDKKLGYLVSTLLLLKHFRDKSYIINQAASIFRYALKYSEDGDMLDVFIYQALVYIALKRKGGRKGSCTNC